MYRILNLAIYHFLNIEEILPKNCIFLYFLFLKIVFHRALVEKYYRSLSLQPRVKINERDTVCYDRNLTALELCNEAYLF